MQTDRESFSSLCEGLCVPSLEKSWAVLNDKRGAIVLRYSTSGFTSPPGAMYGALKDCYRDELEVRAKIIFECCCEAYAASRKKIGSNEFVEVLQATFTIEQERILASGQAEFTQYNAQFKMPSFQLLMEHFRSDVESEGRRVARLYTAKAQAYCGAAVAAANVEDPLELKPNFFGLGIDLKRIWPWIKRKRRK